MGQGKRFSSALVAPENFVKRVVAAMLDLEIEAEFFEWIVGCRVITLDGRRPGDQAHRVGHGVLVVAARLTAMAACACLVADVLDLGSNIAIGGREGQARVCRNRSWRCEGYVCTG